MRLCVCLCVCVCVCVFVRALLTTPFALATWNFAWVLHYGQLKNVFFVFPKKTIFAEKFSKNFPKKNSKFFFGIFFFRIFFRKTLSEYNFILHKSIFKILHVHNTHYGDSLLGWCRVTYISFQNRNCDDINSRYVSVHAANLNGMPHAHSNAGIHNKLHSNTSF